MAKVGWHFPTAADSVYGRIVTTDYEDMIRQSVYLIVSTRKGTRFLQPEFGCGIHDFVFWGTDYTTLKRIENEVVKSIETWENRIESLEVYAMTSNENNNRINIEISYFIPKLRAYIKQGYSMGNE